MPCVPYGGIECGSEPRSSQNRVRPCEMGHIILADFLLLNVVIMHCYWCSL